jgi:hypothetical protein
MFKYFFNLPVLEMLCLLIPIESILWKIVNDAKSCDQLRSGHWVKNFVVIMFGTFEMYVTNQGVLLLKMKKKKSTYPYIYCPKISDFKIAF